MADTSLSLEDYLARRRTELSDAEARLREELRMVLDERTKLDKAALAAGLKQLSEPTSSSALQGSEPRKRVRRASGTTIKEAVLQALAEAGHGLPATDILPRINALLGIQYPRTSLSPQLSRLKQSGELILEGNVWYVPGMQVPESRERGIFE